VLTNRRTIAALAIGILLIAVRVSATEPQGGIAYVGTDSNIYFCNGKCEKPQCLTCPVERLETRKLGIVPATFVRDREPPREYNWPTFSPDGKKLAFIATSPTESSSTFSVQIHDFASHQSFPVFESPRSRPIYIFWLPDGESLSFLVAEPGGFSLMLAKARESSPSRIVMTGIPLFFDWNQPQQELVVHSNASGPARTEQVSLMKLTDNNQEVKKVLHLGHTPFKVPAWSPDRAHLAFVSVKGEQAWLSVADADGADPKPLVKLGQGEASFVWAPNSRQIAYSNAPVPGALMMDGISMLDVAGGTTKKIVSEPVAAFYFSPDSNYLAYIAVPEKRSFYQWKLSDLKSGKSRQLANFITTRDESMAYRFFDQLALSHRIWSPDSKALVFAGVLVKGELPNAMGPAPAPFVFVAAIDELKPRPIAEGTLAFWSPAAN
jgi:Tol biopolymer transport system component